MMAMEEAVKTKAKQKLRRLREQLAKEKTATATALAQSTSMKQELDDLHSSLSAHREFKGRSGDEISSLKSKLMDASTLFDQALTSSKAMEVEMRDVREALRKSEIAQFSEKKSQLDTIAAMSHHETRMLYPPFILHSFSFPSFSPLIGRQYAKYVEMVCYIDFVNHANSCGCIAFGSFRYLITYNGIIMFTRCCYSYKSKISVT
jgi:hypothetical protein